MVGAEDAAGSQRRLHVLATAEEHDAGVAVQMGQVGGVGADDVTGVDLRVGAAQVLVDRQTGVLGSLRPFADQPDGAVPRLPPQRLP